MRFVSWNVNGLRAALKKGFMESFKELDADVFCLQETKMQEGQAILDLPGYAQYFYSAEKKGYAGTAIFTRVKPRSVRFGIGVGEHDAEGRVITMELSDIYLVTVYTPNAKRALERLAYRMVWEDAFRAFLLNLRAKKPVVVCGDLNVAHTEIDLKNPKSNHRNAGFTDEERGKFSELLEAGFIDTFRALHPDRTGAYTWWSYLRHARATNAGWRIDYFLVSEELKNRIAAAEIHADVFGSDHCPVSLTLK